MLRLTATGVMLALCATAVGVICGDERVEAQRPAPSGLEQPGAVHQKFAPAPKVKEPYQRLFQLNQAVETLSQTMHFEGPPRADLIQKSGVWPDDDGGRSEGRPEDVTAAAARSQREPARKAAHQNQRSVASSRRFAATDILALV